MKSNELNTDEFPMQFNQVLKLQKKQHFVIVVLMILFTFAYVPQVFAHGLGGDMAPPISFGGMDVTVFTQLSPSDITVGQVDKANMGIRFFDMATDQNLDSVTYRVEIWRSGELLARELFYDSQGDLNVEIRPNPNCNQSQKIHCSKYFGEREQISNGLMQRGEQAPIIEGPIFDKGGLYNIRVDIEGASSPKTMVSKLLSYDTFVSVAQEQNFDIQTAQEQTIPIIVKTYYDDVQDFEYGKTDNSITFDMPFNWDPNYVDLVKVIHEEIRVPKTFEPYNEGTQFVGYVNGMKLDSRSVLSDPYSSEEQNIVHFLVTGNELKRINEKLSENSDSKNILFKLVPEKGMKKNSFQVNFDSDVTATVEWKSRIDADYEITFDVTFFDPTGNLMKDVRYGYTITNEDNQELFTNIGNDQNNPGILASEGLDTQHVYVPSQGVYELKIAIFGTGVNSKPDLTFAGLGYGFFELADSALDTVQQNEYVEYSLPDWIRTNAGWWAAGQIADEEFASGIEFMIKNGIIDIPMIGNVQATNDVNIPEWVRTNAGWWAAGQIADEEFVKGLKFLVENGIISV